MTDSKTYNVRGAEVIITATAWAATIDVHITIDLSPLDTSLPDHSPMQLMGFFALPGYQSPQSYFWCKKQRKITVRTGSQAQRVIRHALARIDDAIFEALQKRASRQAELKSILA